jgi:hypothetical protein
VSILINGRSWGEWDDDGKPKNKNVSNNANTATTNNTLRDGQYELCIVMF